MSMNTIGFGEPLSHQIYKHILKKIIEGAIKAGDKIVEEDISKELNTSRAPVREALYLLQVDGIVERIPRRGTIVKSFTQSEIEEYNDIMIKLLQAAVDFSHQKWNEENKLLLSEYIKEVNTECEKKSVIDYQLKVDQLLKYILSIAANKPLTRFYEESNNILKVFAQSQWSTRTMENFHSKFNVFSTAMLDSDFDKANMAIYEALKLGVK